jgi:hypothetical protein
VAERVLEHGAVAIRSRGARCERLHEAVEAASAAELHGVPPSAVIVLCIGGGEAVAAMVEAP